MANNQLSPCKWPPFLGPIDLNMCIFKVLVFIALISMFPQVAFSTIYIRQDGVATISSTTGCNNVASAVNLEDYNRSDHDNSEIVCLCREGGRFTSKLKPRAHSTIYNGDCDGNFLNAQFKVENDDAIVTNYKDNLIFKNIDILSIADRKAGINIQDGSDNTQVAKCNIDDLFAALPSFGIKVYLGDANDGNTVGTYIHHSTFRLNPLSEGIRFSHHSSIYQNTYGNTRIIDNYIINSKYAIRHYLSPESRPNVMSNDLRAFNIKINSNRIHKTLRSAIDHAIGVVGNSQINRNVITDCGDAETPSVNCIQLHWVDRMLIRGNVVDGTNTSKCDGATLIFDWTDKNDLHISTNNEASYNIFMNGNAACGSKGIAIWKGKNNFIHDNFILNFTGPGIKLSNDNSTDNVFSKNKIFNVKDCFKLSDPLSRIGVPESTWVENLCLGASSKGFKVLHGSMEPIAEDNIIYDAVEGNDVELDSSNEVYNVN